LLCSWPKIKLLEVFLAVRGACLPTLAVNWDHFRTPSKRFSAVLISPPRLFSARAAPWAVQRSIARILRCLRKSNFPVLIIFREGSALASVERFQRMSARRRGFRPRSLLRQMAWSHSFGCVLQGSLVWLAPCERIECARSAHENSSMYIYMYIYIYIYILR
jgi:hypothetical protein